MKPQRYVLQPFTNRAGNPDVKMIEHPHGEWLRYEDMNSDPRLGNRFNILQALVDLEDELRTAGINMTIRLEKIDAAFSEGQIRFGIDCDNAP